MAEYCSDATLQSFDEDELADEVEDSVLFQEMMQVNVPLQVHKESQ